MVISFTASFFIIISRKSTAIIRWMAVFFINLLTILYLTITLGLFGVILDTIMDLSGIRVGNSNIILSSNGCNILKSMHASGWEINDGFCTLYDVTIQSTLEPAMQISCARKTNEHKEKEITVKLEDSSDHIKIANEDNNGSFSIPTKYIQSIQKTNGLKNPISMDVCP